MNWAVHKFPLTPPDGQQPCSVTMPAGANILTVQAQGDIPCIWAEVPIPPLKEAARVRQFWIRQTGEIFVPGKYLGTVLLAMGSFVLHIYEAPAP